MTEPQEITHPFASALLRWYGGHGRDLPWRHTRDPYAIWLSEVILQQTRVQQGMAYWERFMRRWPTVQHLAAATEDEVLRQWQGLGYYSRARHLHEAARQVAAMGRFPDTLDEIRRLSGVGPYTAAAIGSLAFGLPVAVVDGNVYRVLARHFGIDVPINAGSGPKLFAQLAQRLLPAAQSATYNQAVMDFGAVQCTPQSPRCPSCPIVETCEALRSGRVGQLPVKLRKTKVTTRRLVYAYVRWQGQTALRRRPSGDIWQGLWEPLLLATSDSAPADAPSMPPGALLLRKDVRHVLTHRVLLADFYLWTPERRPQLPPEYVWMDEDDVADHALPRLVELLLASLPSSPLSPSSSH